MASKEYKERLKIENPEKYKEVYLGGQKRYRDKLKESNPEKYKDIYSQQKKRWKQRNPEKAKLQKKFEKIKSKYGITYEQYYSRLDLQNKLCKSCGDELKTDRGTHIDHCHNTGVVRGILCMSCNIILGHAKDDIERLKKLIFYLST